MRTLILKEDVGLERIGEVMHTLDLVLVREETVLEMFRQLWMPSDRLSAVHYIDDPLTKIRYLSIRGEKQRPLAKSLSKRLPIWARDELLAHALELLIKGSDDERQRVAFEIAAEMDEYDAASAGVLTAFLKMDEPAIRLAGARAFRTRPWSIFRGTAEGLTTDTDPEVAAVGRDMLARITELHGA